MANDLHQLSFEQLQDLIDRAQTRLKTARKDDIAQARRKIEAVLAQHGVTLDEVFQRRRKRGPREAKLPRPPKYQNPQNPGQVWSGMGRKPAWITEAIRHGAILDHFLIAGTAKVSKRSRSRAEE